MTYLGYTDPQYWNWLFAQAYSPAVAPSTPTPTPTPTPSPTPTPTPTPSPTSNVATANIFPGGLYAWGVNQTPAVGVRCYNNGNAYQCIQTGTVQTAPVGTGQAIQDGTVVWKWLSTYDYTSVSAWVNTMPSVLATPYRGVVWSTGNGPITTTAGTAFFTLTGHTTSSANTITLVAAPGDSIRDYVAAGNPLTSNTLHGICFQLPNAAGGINYIEIDDDNVILDGFQFVDPNATSNSTILYQSAQCSALTLRNCVFDGTPQPGCNLIDGEGAGSLNLINTLVIDRQAAASGNVAVFVDTNTAMTFVNSTFVCPNNNTAGTAIGAGNNGNVVGGTVRNCSFFGYSQPIFAGSADHCCFSATSLPSSEASDNGNNLFGKTAGNNFVSASADFRLKAGADCLGAGIVDTTDIPTADDIAYNARGSSWTIGCWQ